MIAEQMDDRASMIDRISNLPDEIIHHILSFLDMKYVIQTSALSKRWKHIWTSMPHLNLDSLTFRTSAKFVKFVNDALSRRNHGTQVSAVELFFRGTATQFDVVLKSIVNYAYSHNVRKLTLEWLMLKNEVLMLPQYLFSSHTLKHLTLAMHYFIRFGPSAPISAWDFPVMETLNLSNVSFGGDGDKSLNPFSKCVNLKDLTLHGYNMRGVNIFNICAPKLSNLTITDPGTFPKVFNVVAPQLKNLTATVRDTYSKLMQLSIEDLDSLEEVNLYMGTPPSYKKEIYAPRLLDLFQKLHGAKFLILDKGIIEVIEACLDQLSDEPCPFNNLKFLKIDNQNYRRATMPRQVRKYFLESSPSVAFIKDLSKERYYGRLSSVKLGNRKKV